MLPLSGSNTRSQTKVAAREMLVVIETVDAARRPIGTLAVVAEVAVAPATAAAVAARPDPEARRLLRPQSKKAASDQVPWTRTN